MEKDKEIKTGNSEKKITRKQAIQKAGITALTTASLVFLQTKTSSATSTDTIGAPDRAPERGRTVNTQPLVGNSTDNDKSNNGNHNGQDKNR